TTTVTQHSTGSSRERERERCRGSGTTTTTSRLPRRRAPTRCSRSSAAPTRTTAWPSATAPSCWPRSTPRTVPRSCSGSGARATTSAGRSSLGERTKETTSWYPNNNSAGCGDPKIKEAGCDASRTSRVVFASDSQPLWG
ncbi:hydroxyproline-rich glycoprotein family protein, partial [Zea mays]